MFIGLLIRVEKVCYLSDRIPITIHTEQLEPVFVHGLYKTLAIARL